MDSTEFHVPHPFKIAFVWLAIVMVATLLGYQFNKRANYMGLHIKNVMQPAVVASKPNFESKLPTLFENTAQVGADSRPTLYHFWATWCAPCRSEIPTLQDLQRHFKGDLRVVTVAVDENKDDVIRFFSGVSPSFLVLWDQSQVVSELWGVKKFPETFFVAPKSGQMIRFSGAKTWNSPEVIDYVSQLIRPS